MSKGNFFSKLTKCAALALVFGIVGGSAFSGVTCFTEHYLKPEDVLEEEETAEAIKIQPASTAVNITSKDISGVVDEVMPSIVAITSMTQQEILGFFGQGQIVENESSGSGILVNKDEEYLYIATNNHVVEGSTALTVQFLDETTAPATLRGTDSADDLAVVQVALSDLSEDTRNAIRLIKIGDSDALAVGNPAIAIGNALGYGQSVTTGVISALGREVTFQDEMTGESFSSRLIQTDAAINPGNSGGALINDEGELIGINSSKYSDTSVEGMGFAIPISSAQPILEDLISNGKVTNSGTPYLGIYGVDVTDEVSKQYHMPRGVYVARVVEGSGAKAAGIMTGNIISKVEGEEVDSMEKLKECISEYQVGDTIKLTVLIANSGTYLEKEVSVTLTGQSYD